MGVYKYATTSDAYAGLAQSAVTSNVFFAGDARLVAFSLTSASTTASVWTVQGNASDGFFSAVDATAWQSVETVGAQGFYTLATEPRWLRFLRTPSASSTTLTLSLSVGP